VSVPIGVKFVIKDEAFEENGTTKFKSKISKNEHFRDLIKVAVKNDVKFRYVLNDSWFCNAENMKFIHYETESYFIIAIKDNRKVALSLEDKQAGKYIDIKEAVIEICYSPKTVQVVKI
jgi:hypothetical protein